MEDPTAFAWKVNCLPWHQLFGEAELRRLRAGPRTSPYLQSFTTLSNAVSRKNNFPKTLCWHFSRGKVSLNWGKKGIVDLRLDFKSKISFFYSCLARIIKKIALILVVSKLFTWYEHNWYLQNAIYVLLKWTKNTPYSITICRFNIDVKWRTALSWIHGVTDQDKSLWSEIMCR